MTHDCPECGTSFDERNSVIAHMASKIDEDHKGIGYQKAEQLLGISESETEDHEISGQSVSDPDPTPATDGGTTPMEPPTPDTSTGDDQQGGRHDQPDDLPDHVVTVEEYVEAARDRGVERENLRQLREALSDHDLVDTEETTDKSIAALNWGDLDE